MFRLAVSSALVILAVLPLAATSGHWWPLGESQASGNPTPQPIQSKNLLQRGQVRDNSSALQSAFPALTAEIASPLQAGAECKPCNVSAGESCPFTEMSGRTCVYPGTPTTCLDGPFAFEVLPGDHDKVLFFFQGGGACISKDIQVCTRTIATGGGGITTGVFDKSHAHNPFTNYTIISVPYCSGDAFIGRADNEVGKQFGYENALAAVKWTQENVNGDTKLQSLVISGDSAGSLGAQYWASHMLKTFTYEQAAVLADSYAGVFPLSKMLPVLEMWKSCDLPIWSPSVKAKCNSSTDPITVADTFDDAISSFPSVRFANIQSKEDPVQKAFYCAVKEGNMVGALLCVATYPAAHLYYQANLFFERYNKHPNYVAYVVEGKQHTFTETPFFYTASAKGPQTDGVPMMYEWVGQFAKGDASSVTTTCTGPVKAAIESSVDYCDEKLMNKTLSPASTYV